MLIVGTVHFLQCGSAASYAGIVLAVIGVVYPSHAGIVSKQHKL